MFVAFQMFPGTESEWRMSNIKEGKFEVRTNCTTSRSSRKTRKNQEKFICDACKLLPVHLFWGHTHRT